MKMKCKKIRENLKLIFFLRSAPWQDAQPIWDDIVEFGHALDAQLGSPMQATNEGVDELHLPRVPLMSQIPPYEGAPHGSILSCIICLLSLQAMNGWSNESMDGLLRFDIFISSINHSKFKTQIKLLLDFCFNHIMWIFTIFLDGLFMCDLGIIDHEHYIWHKIHTLSYVLWYVLFAFQLQSYVHTCQNLTTYKNLHMCMVKCALV